MRLVNITYDTPGLLQKDLAKQGISKDADEQYFVQIFMSTQDKNKAQEIINTLNETIPCHILLAQSSKETIAANHILEDEDVISISCFKTTSMKQVYCPTSMSIQDIRENIQSIITERTKLMVIFVSNGSFYQYDILSEIEDITENIIITGGRTSPFKEHGGLIGDNNGIYDDGLVALSIDSDILYAKNSFVFGWENIGPKLKITKAHDNIVYEINNQKAIDIYRKYLGDTAIDNFSISAYMFPFVFEVSGMRVARIPFYITDDGGIAFNDNVPEGTEVNFTFGLIDNIRRQFHKTYAELPCNIEGIYFYSCIGRLIFLGKDNLSNLLETFLEIPSTGFFTHGEIYCSNNKNVFLSLTNTFVFLIEGEPDYSKEMTKTSDHKPSRQALILDAISHLSQTVNKEIIEATNKIQAYHRLVDDAMLHVITDEALNVLYVNDRLIEATGFSKDDIIGKNALDFLNEESRANALNSIIPQLQTGHWAGKLCQKRADGTLYHVKAAAQAMLNDEGEVTGYLIGELDETNDELRRMALERDANFLRRTDEERRFLLEQYERVINSSQCFFRLDLQKNFIYANDIFAEITGLDPNFIVGRNIYEFIESEEHWQWQFINQALGKEGEYKGILEHTRPNGEKRYIKSSGYVIKDLNQQPIEIIAVGTDITQVVNNAKEIESIQKDVIYAMGTICEGKSRETGNHIIRVAEYSALLAKLYGLSKDDIELLRIASPMHDIGKIGIPDAILNKPGKLTPEEFEIIKTHTTIGEEIFKNSSRSILKTAGQIAGSHHEWWDGNGYPKKLSGEDIPLFGRITALADTFDALSNDRCYKKAWPIDEVIEYIKNLRGKQFQPELVDLFLDNLDEFLHISKQYQDPYTQSDNTPPPPGANELHPLRLT